MCIFYLFGTFILKEGITSPGSTQLTVISKLLFSQTLISCVDYLGYLLPSFNC